MIILRITFLDKLHSLKFFFPSFIFTDVSDLNDNVIKPETTLPNQVKNSTNGNSDIDTPKNMTANVQDAVEKRSYQKVTMTKGKHLSGHKKRENKGKPSAPIGFGQNGVDASTNIQTAIPTSCAMLYNNKTNNSNLSKPTLNAHLKTEPTSKDRTSSSFVNPDGTVNAIAGTSNSVGGGNAFQTTNMPASQYYVLSKIMHQQQKKMQQQPPQDLSVRKQIGNSLNVPILTTTSTTTSTFNTMKTTSSGSTLGTRPSNTTSIDQSNINSISNVEDTICQCHLVLDPYPSHLSWR